MTNVAHAIFLLASTALGLGLENEPLEAQVSSPRRHIPQSQKPGAPRHQCCSTDGPDTDSAGTRDCVQAGP